MPVRPSWYYERQAQEAQARENYFRNRTPPPEPTTIESRGAMTDLFYRSMLQLSGTDPVIYRVSVPDATLDLCSATQAGLLTTLGASQTAQRLRGSGLKPTKLHWYRGRANAIRRTTAWGTRSAVYYDDAAGRSHYSIPFSRTTGIVEPSDIQDAFNGLFGATGTLRNLLGAANGRAHITWEKVTVSAQS